MRAKRAKRKTTRSSQVETKGTMIKYLSKYIVGGDDMVVGGRKRKVEATCAETPEMEMDQKRLKSSQDPEQTDGGPKSATRTEPEAFQMMKIKCKEGRTPLGIREKSLL